MAPERIQQEAEENPANTVSSAHEAEKQGGTVGVYPVLDCVVSHKVEVREYAQVNQEVGVEQEEDSRGAQKFLVPCRFARCFFAFEQEQTPPQGL